MTLRRSRRSAGRRVSRTGARTARASSGCATPPTSRSTRRAAVPACRSRSSTRSPRRRRRSGGRANSRGTCRHDRDEPARRSPASTPIRPEPRAHPARPSLFGDAWAEGRDLDLATLIQQIQPRRSQQSASSISSRSSRRRTGLRWPCSSTTFWPHRVRRSGSKAIRWTSPPAPTRRDGQAARADLLDRAPGRRRADVLRVAAAQSGRWRGCERSRARPACARSSTWTRSSATFRRSRIRRPSARCSRCSSRRGRSASASCWRRRTRSTWTTRAWRTPARGSSAGCRPSATRRACWMDSKAQPSGSMDRNETDRLLSALDKRVFLMHNVHDKGPVVFQTRWTLSYLRGPLSRDQIRQLTPARAAAVESEQHASCLRSGTVRRRATEDGSGVRVETGWSSADPSAGPAAVLRTGNDRRLDSLSSRRPRRGSRQLWRQQAGHRQGPGRRLCRGHQSGSGSRRLGRGSEAGRSNCAAPRHGGLRRDL